MEHRKAIQRAIDYIEAHLQDELDNTVLARAAGYSEFHFLRLFKEIVHLTPADYIRKRRISEIARRIGEGKSSIADIALTYGFHSSENFIRAFKREHHILPTDFRTANNSLKLYGRLVLDPLDMELQPVLKHLDAFQVVAYPSDEAFPPHFWNKYNANGWSEKLTGGRVTEDYGVSIWNEQEKRLDYAIGVHQKNALGDLSHTIIISIPQGLYAVFQTPPADSFSFVNNIHRTWETINRVWLPQSGYRRVKGPEFEINQEKSHTYQEMIYVPVCREE